MSLRLTVATALVAICLSTTARADVAAEQTWVSGVGDDLNPCTRTAPCATFQAALAVTSDGGQVVALDEGNFGPVVIDRSVTLTGIARYAGVNGPTGITVAAGSSSTVALRNLNLRGDFSPGNGIQFVQGGTLKIENCVVEAFDGHGIAFNPDAGGGQLFLRNVVVRDNTGSGLLLGTGDATPVRAMIERSSLVGNGTGAQLQADTAATFFDSVLSFNGGAALSVLSGGRSAQANVEDATISNNDFGLDVGSTTGGSAIIRLSNTFVDEQTTALTRVTGTGAVLTYGNNRLVHAQGATCAEGFVTLTPRSIPEPTVGDSYSVSTTILGALGPVAYSSSALPPGLSYADGALSGIPTKSGTFSVTLTATDGNGCGDDISTTVQVNCPTMSLLPASVASVVTGEYLSVAFSRQGGYGEAQFQLSGSVPAGLAFENATLAGYPTEPGTFAFSVTALDAAECSVSSDYSLTVTASPSFQATTLSLTPSGASVESGATLTLAATVNGASGSPTGGVTFQDGSSALGTAAVTNGVATLDVKLHGVGTRALTAHYSGDRVNGASRSDQLTMVVTAASTTVTLVSAGPSTFGEEASFTATVTSFDGIPAGSVEFFDRATPLGTVLLDNLGIATLTTALLDGGEHTITARYLGSADFLESTSNEVLQVVSPATTTTTLASTSPTTFGESVTFTATVESSAGIPAGTIEFFDGSNWLCTTSLDEDGKATCTTAELGGGERTITAEYHATANFAGSASAALMHTVNPVPTGTGLTTSGASYVGEMVTLTATVTTALGKATGMVTFRDGDFVLGASALKSDNVATFSTSSLSAGDHQLTAHFEGSANLAASTSDVVVQTVTAPKFTVAVAQAPQELTGQQGVSAQLKYSVQGHLGAPIQLSCQDLPATTTCSFDPAEVGAAPGETTVTVTIAQAKSASNEGTADSKLALAAFAPLLLLGVRLRRRQLLTRTFTLAFGLVAMLGLSACGGTKNKPTGIPAGHYTVTVVSTSGNITIPTPLEITIK